jgi:hypothetical protein
VLDVVVLGGLDDPRQHDFAVNGLLHELRKRRIVAGDYAGTTLRENLGLELPPEAGGRRSPAPATRHCAMRATRGRARRVRRTRVQRRLSRRQFLAAPSAPGQAHVRRPGARRVRHRRRFV